VPRRPARLGHVDDHAIDELLQGIDSLSRCCNDLGGTPKTKQWLLIADQCVLLPQHGIPRANAP
jgi:hypothetical protein